jgi:hypothetical protein
MITYVNVYYVFSLFQHFLCPRKFVLSLLKFTKGVYEIKVMSMCMFFFVPLAHLCFWMPLYNKERCVRSSLLYYYLKNIKLEITSINHIKMEKI